MKPKVSIIIPIFNAERFITRCINSILNQNFKNFELLLIDDGSTDNSADICNNFSKIDTRVKVFHKINGGVGSARNLGLKHANGEYIFFIDSDDFILENSLSFFLELDSAQNDLYMFKTSIFKNETIIGNKYSEKKVKLKNEVWNYIFKKEIIDENSIEFIDVKYGEDYNFVAKYFMCVKTKRFIDQFVYVYKSDSPGSAMNKPKNIHYVFDHFKMINDLIDFISLHPKLHNQEIFSGLLNRGFKMTLVVIAKTVINPSYKKEVLKKYHKMYDNASKWSNLFKFHPLFIKSWIMYYKIRLK